MNPIDTKLAEISGATTALNLACDAAQDRGGEPPSTPARELPDFPLRDTPTDP